MACRRASPHQVIQVHSYASRLWTGPSGPLPCDGLAVGGAISRMVRRPHRGRGSMTSVVPARAHARSVEGAASAGVAAHPSLVADTRWLRRLSRRLQLLDAVVVAVTITL